MKWAVNNEFMKEQMNVVRFKKKKRGEEQHECEFCLSIRWCNPVSAVDKTFPYEWVGRLEIQLSGP